jgi:hypothetical protein
MLGFKPWSIKLSVSHPIYYPILAPNIEGAFSL